MFLFTPPPTHPFLCAFNSEILLAELYELRQWKSEDRCYQCQPVDVLSSVHLPVCVSDFTNVDVLWHCYITRISLLLYRLWICSYTSWEPGWWWWWLFPCLHGFWENVRPFPACAFFFKVEISSHALIPPYMPGSAHSGSAS